MPVLPNPFSPLSLIDISETSIKLSGSYFAKTICAILSPLFISNNSLDKFTKRTPISPVKKGDPIIILEAMKMENILTSPIDGVIKNIEVKAQQTVEKNNVLIRFES